MAITIIACTKSTPSGNFSSSPGMGTGGGSGNNPPPKKLRVEVRPISHEISLPSNTITTVANPMYSSQGGTPVISSVLWRKIEGPSTFTIATPGHLSTNIENLGTGTYIFECKVTDTAGSSDSVTTVISVSNPANPLQRISYYNQKWIDHGMGMSFLINLTQYLAAGLAVKEVYLRTDCAATPFRIFNLFNNPPNHSYCYLLEYFNNTLWLHVGYYTTGPDQCTLPVDTPDVEIVMQ